MWAHTDGASDWLLRSLVPSGDSGIAAFNDCQIQFSYNGAALTLNANPAVATGLKNVIVPKNTCKAWVKFKLNNPGRTILDGVNIADVTLSTTAVTVAFVEPLVDANYAYAIQWVDRGLATNVWLPGGTVGGQLSTQFSFEYRSGVNILADPTAIELKDTVWSIIVFGTQA